MGSQPQEKIIENVQISLRGFTKSEIKDIVGYIRSVEAFRPTRLMFVEIEDLDISVEEAKRLVKEIWPEPSGPPFIAVFKRKNIEE